MRRFLQSRFFVVITVITLILVAVPTLLSTFGLPNPLRGAVNVLMTPLQKGFNYITDALDGYTAYFTEFDELVAEKLTTYFRSVVVFGRVRILEDTEEKRAAVTALARHYFPEMEEKIQKEASGALKNLCMLELNIEHMSGKEAIELVQQKSEG